MTEFNESVSDTLTFGEILTYSIPEPYHQIEIRTRDTIIDQIVYELKRTRPSRLDLYKIAYHTVDLETGKKTVGTERLRFDRAVVLPSQMESKFTFDLAYLAASRDFTQGGFYQQRLQTVLLDAQDFPDSWGQPTTDQYAVQDGMRWEILKVTNIGWRSFALVLQATDGQEVELGEDANNNLNLTHSVEVTK